MELSFAICHSWKYQTLRFCLQGMFGFKLHLMQILTLSQVNTNLWNFNNVVRWQSVSQRLLGEVIHCFLLLFCAQAYLLKRGFRNLAVLLKTIEAFKISL
jgi:hypothetical protein